MTRYECKLSAELLNKATRELNEPQDNIERLKAIDELRASYDSATFGPLFSSEDLFLLRFLRAKKFNQPKALATLINYHQTRRSYKEVFDKVSDPAQTKKIFEGDFLAVINAAGKDGSCVVIEKLAFITRKVDIHVIAAYGVLTVEKLLQNEQNQICGIQMIYDVEGFSTSTLATLSPITLAKINSIFQDAMPLRVKALHLVNEGLVINAILAIYKLFLKEKLINRIYAHGKETNQLKEMIKPEMIPEVYGGSSCSFEELSHNWNMQLKEHTKF